ncbi:MAG: hypothetical protein V2A76_18795 [Planctomycetota bacterium]
MERASRIKNLSAVTVCVNYSQYLEIAARNRSQFDRWIVVTNREDRETQEVCRKHGLDVVLTERLRQNGDPFNKGKAINDGLDALGDSDWILLLDADILLPDNFREAVQQNDLRTDHIYACKYRGLCRDLAAYERLKSAVEARRERRRHPALGWVLRKLFGRSRTRNWFVRRPKKVFQTHPVLSNQDVMEEFDRRGRHCEKMGRVDGRWRSPSLTDEEIFGLKHDWLARHADHDCFERNDFKAGFLQLFHSSSKKRYSEEHGTAGTSDTLFFEQFSETRDESGRYQGKIGRFTVRNWGHLQVPAPLAGCGQGYLVCYHLGPVYENWLGTDPVSPPTP